MSKKEERYIVVGLILAALGCVAAWLAVPQVQSLLDSKTPSASSNTSPTAATATRTPLPMPVGSPYQDAFIELISATPDSKIPLRATDDVRYNYTIRYYIPQFDWKDFGYEPRIQLERVVNISQGMEIATLNDISPEIGKAQTIDITGMFIVPSDRNVWQLRIKITYVNTQRKEGHTSGNQIIDLKYSIAKTP